MSTPDEIADALRAGVSGRVETLAPLAPFTTYRLGGPADVLVEAESEDDLVAVAHVARGSVPVAIVGRGSNLLVSDDGFRGIAVRLGRAFRTHERTDHGLVFGGAVYLPAAAKLTGRLGLAGFEFAAEIPATFGGAVRMNAGAHGRSIADVLRWTRVVDLESGSVRQLDVAELGLSYRHSSFATTEVVTAGEVELEPGEPREILAKIGELLRWRRENQPGGRSAGSVFKNPPGDGAGRLVESAGCKGLRIGGAQVSPVHANFIVADADARAGDVWTLVELCKARVREREGVELEPEMRFLGTFPQVTAEALSKVEGEGA